MAVMAEFTTAQRKQMAKAGTAMPDGGYPIRNRDDLKNAIQAVGRAGSPQEIAAARRFIMKRARALDLASMIPPNWNSDGTVKSGGS